MQQSKKFRSFMNIMCVTCNKTIFYNFFIVNLGSSKTQAYKDESFTPKIPRKRKEKNKNIWFFSPGVSTPSPACTYTTYKYCLTLFIDVITILFYYIRAPMANIIPINFPSISFQIHAVTFFVSIVNNANKLSFHFYLNQHSNMEQNKKIWTINKYYVCKMHGHDCLRRDSISQSLHLIQSLNLQT
jgi:hypothetical protein